MAARRPLGALTNQQQTPAPQPQKPQAAAPQPQKPQAAAPRPAVYRCDHCFSFTGSYAAVAAHDAERQRARKLSTGRPEMRKSSRDITTFLSGSAFDRDPSLSYLDPGGTSPIWHRTAPRNGPTTPPRSWSQRMASQDMLFRETLEPTDLPAAILAADKSCSRRDTRVEDARVATRDGRVGGQDRGGAGGNVGGAAADGERQYRSTCRGAAAQRAWKATHCRRSASICRSAPLGTPSFGRPCASPALSARSAAR